eukprot:CAMPEP_0118947702 /NCGR_PEP_ID=MMETSP1169-20130426/46523_1 /TAXON_ID=36882 /ORGANISM="Pyramimonas obovata, Strain CCMP722" /LENGTH=370 /DNA_ID=CAMNT_0006893969 /DNA_START=349 /DNA_END=1459 /DNA_ORIENTATION=-
MIRLDLDNHYSEERKDLGVEMVARGRSDTSVQLGRRWSPIPQTAEVLGKRGGHSSTVVGKNIYVIGGRVETQDGGSEQFFNDTLRLDLQHNRWERLCLDAPFAPRAYHSATLVGEEIWLIGGSDLSHIYPDVHVLDLVTLTWREVTRSIKGDPLAATGRTGHRAIRHPSDSNTILIYGGFTSQESTGGAYVGLLTALDTKRKVMSDLRPRGVSPTPRGYHAFVAVGSSRCLIIGGRTSQEDGNWQLVEGSDFVVLYNSETNTWEHPTCTGAAMPARANFGATCIASASQTPPAHPLLALDGSSSNGEGLLVTHGGAKGAKNGGQRLSDMWLLHVSWRKGGGPAASTEVRWIEGSTAEPMETAGDSAMFPG